VAIDERVGSAELKLLAEDLAPPCRIGDFVLEGLISKTTTALVFVARGGAFGTSEGVLKLTGSAYAPLLERELERLERCREADVAGVVRPVRDELVWLTLVGEGEEKDGDDRPTSVAALLLPFLSGGDLVQWIGARATRTDHLGAEPALEIGERVGALLRGMLELPRPLVHGDVKPQNVLLPEPGATLGELTLIDLDASSELDALPTDLSRAPRGVVQCLVSDINGFGELLYELATGHEPPSEGDANPETGNAAFDGLVVRCMNADVDTHAYTSLHDEALWRDLALARAVEDRRMRRRALPDLLHSRLFLGAVGLVLFCLLVLAVMAKVPAGG
jgi:hypothetical protein